MSISHLSQTTVKLIGSSQIITSISAAVKELLENALDSGASCVDVKLEKSGMEKIEVRDNGSGVKKNDAACMCRSHCTSKITAFDDLNDLYTYGFRGEALGALCKVADVAVTTKTCEDDVATTYKFDKNGDVVNEKPSHLPQGTTIIVSNIFKSLPVRKQLYSSSKKLAEELRKIESLVKFYSVINPNLRVTFCHNKCLIWQKSSVSSLRQAMMQAFGHSIVAQLDDLSWKSRESTVEMLIPKKKGNISQLCHATSDCMLIFINKRPVHDKQIEKVLMQHVSRHFEVPPHRHPTALVCIEVEPSDVDVNLEPNKTKVFLRSQDTILDKLHAMLGNYYDTNQEDGNPSEAIVENSAPKNPVLDTTSSDTESNNFDNQGKSFVHVPEKIPCDYEDEKTVKKMRTNNFLPNITVSEIQEDRSVHSKLSSSCEKTVPVGFVNKSCDDKNGASDVVDVNFSTACNVPVQNGGPINSTLREELILLEDSIPFDEVELQLKAAELELPVPPTKQISKDVIIPDDAKTDIALPSVKDSSNMDAEEPETPFAVHKDGNGTALGLVAVDDFSAEDWSRGKVTTKDGSAVKSGAQLLVPGVKVNGVPPVKNRSRSPVKRKCESADVSMHSVCSQMGRKEMRAFTVFSKEARPKILQENPGISFTRVGTLLAAKWRTLAEDEKERYEKLAQDIEKQKVESRISTKIDESSVFPNMQGKKQAVVGIRSVLDKMAAAVKPGGNGKGPKWTTVDVSLSLESLAERVSRIGLRQNDLPKISLVGQLKPSGMWIYKRKEQVGLLKHFGLQEVVVFHKLLEEHTIPLKMLEFSVPVDESVLGLELWNLLLTLERSYDVFLQTTVIVSKVIAKNGFRIIIKDECGKQVAFITEIAEVIRFYGIDELKEVLELVKSFGEANLKECRPLKVLNFLKGEAVRMSQQSPAIFDKVTLRELLDYWSCNLRSEENCLHSKSILVPLYSFAEKKILQNGIYK